SPKVDFTRMSLLNFWAARQQEYPELSCKAVIFLLLFATTYLCESGFSHSPMIKITEIDLTLKFSKISSDITAISDKKQAHPSHINTSQQLFSEFRLIVLRIVKCLNSDILFQIFF